MKNTQPLLKLLNEQLEVCKKYLDVQKSMTEAIVVGDIKQIDSIVKDEQYFVLKIESLENQREKLLEQDSLEDLPINEIIANHVEEEYKEEYESTFENLFKVLVDLKRSTQLNQRLLKQRLSVFDHMVEVCEGESVRRA